jgi:hypothetical protein
MENIRKLVEDGMIHEVGKYWQEKKEDMQRTPAHCPPRTAIGYGLRGQRGWKRPRKRLKVE